jgi:long-chain acyl-CoA synthetase
MNFSDIAALPESERLAHLLEHVHENGQPIFAGSFIARAARLAPKKIALISGSKEITFAALARRVNHVTELLRAKGIKSGDRVMVIFENSIEFYVAYYGAWQAGAVVAPLNTFLVERELRHIIDDAKPFAVIVSKTFSESIAGISALMLTEADLQADGPEIVAIDAHDPDALSVLLYTSGTTGFPKGVMISSRGILHSAIQGIARLELSEHERMLGLLPFFHSFAQITCIWAAMLAVIPVIIVPKIERRNIVEGLSHNPTIFLGVPALYGVLCLMRTAALDSVRYFITGGDAMPDKIRSAFQLIYRRKLCSGYGLTEAGPTIAAEIEDVLLPANCVGRPLLEVTCSIRDEQTGQEMPQGEIGVLWVKGPNLMLGYYQAPEQTREVLVDGWLNTGDFARVDTDGRLYISGRAKDLIKNKGINIYPPEVENVLMSHPAVTMAAVVGKPYAEVGEVPVAFVAVRAITPTLEAELKTLCLEQLAGYKVPQQFFIFEQLPMTALGKIDKKKLKAEYLT